MAEKKMQYTTVAGNYDKMINWEKRLAREIPFFTSILNEIKGNKIFDCACATGQHAVKLAEMGYQVTGSDLNLDMISQGRILAEKKGVKVDFLQSNFLDLNKNIKEQFNLIMCIGNSLPHIKDVDELQTSLKNMYDRLLPEGKLVIQNKNYDKLINDKYQLMPLTNWYENNDNKLFIRINELNSNQKVSFTILTLTKDNNDWRMEAERTELFPIQQAKINELLLEIGFKDIIFYGDYEKKLFELNSSGDLIILAAK